MAFGRRPPLYVFLLPQFFELLFKVSYFFLSIHFGLQGLSKITFWGPWTYSTIHLPYKLRNLVALRGQKSKKNGYLRIQGRMQIFEKMSQMALNRVLTLPDCRSRCQLPESGLGSQKGPLGAELWSSYCRKRMLVPMSYISFWDIQKCIEIRIF